MVGVGTIEPIDILHVHAKRLSDRFPILRRISKEAYEQNHRDKALHKDEHLAEHHFVLHPHLPLDDIDGLGAGNDQGRDEARNQPHKEDQQEIIQPASPRKGHTHIEAQFTVRLEKGIDFRNDRVGKQQAQQEAGCRQTKGFHQQLADNLPAGRAQEPARGHLLGPERPHRHIERNVIEQGEEQQHQTQDQDDTEDIFVGTGQRAAPNAGHFIVAVQTHVIPKRFLFLLLRQPLEKSVIDPGRPADFFGQLLPVGTGLHLEETQVFIVHPLRILPIILERRPCNVDEHVVRAHQGAVIVIDNSLDGIFQRVQDEMLSDGIPAIPDLLGKRLRNQGIRVVLQHFPTAGEEPGRKEIEVIEVAEQQFDAIALVAHFDVGRTRGAEERRLLHLRNVLLQEFLIRDIIVIQVTQTVI